MTPKLAIPDNITVLALPPRSPELNPVENVWQFMRDKLSNRIFKSYEDIVGCAAKPGTTSGRPTMEDHVPRHASKWAAWVPINDRCRITPLPCRGQEDLPERLFAPLGYQVSTESHLLDPALADWGASSYRTVSLSGQCRLADLLSHLYVLIPVLDADKHYWVGDDEVDKLLRRGEGWLARHPEKELIARRYLKRQAHLTREALARLADDQSEDSDRAREARADEEQTLERPIRLHDLRLETVSAALRAGPARRVLDLGCGEGRLLQMLLRDPQFIEIVGLDTSVRALERARDRLRLERMAPRQRARIQLLHGALTYRDQRLAGYDAAAAVEVVEHLDPPRLAAFERVVFACARPGKLVLTTPNVE